MSNEKPLRDRRRTVLRVATLVVAASISWIAFALLCHGPLQGFVFRIYSDRAREIVQVRCGRPVDNELIYTLTPGVCRFRNAEFDTEVRVDEDGFRNSPEHRGSGPLSVAVLGDSFAMGWGVEQHEKVASLLARDARLNVHDLSMSSYGTARELFALERLAADARVVILQYCQNDVAENADFLLSPKAFVANSAGRAVEFEDLRHSIGEAGSLNDASRRLLGTGLSALAATWRAFGLPPRELPATLVPGISEEARLFAGVLASFRESLEDRVVVVFDLHARRVRGGMDDALREALDRVGLSRVRVLDLEGTIDMDDYFHLDEHLNARGHAALAKRILEEIDRIDEVDQTDQVDGIEAAKRLR